MTSNDLLTQLVAELAALDARRPVLVRAVAALRGLEDPPTGATGRIARGTLEPMILDAMRKRPEGITHGQLVAMLNGSGSSVANKLAALYHQRKIKRIGRGIWTIA